MFIFSLLSAPNDPWHWSISGIIIGLIVPALLLIGNKSFGISSSLQHICSLASPSKTSFFNYDLKTYRWSFYFIAGILLGGFISYIWGNVDGLTLGAKTQHFLSVNELIPPTSLYPTDLFNIHNTKGILLMMVGGFLIGFGTRWANGCTSGHSILGISNLKLSSLVATIAFFLGGMAMTHYMLPFLLKL